MMPPGLRGSRAVIATDGPLCRPVAVEFFAFLACVNAGPIDGERTKHTISFPVIVARRKARPIECYDLRNSK
jgi:hypothetical protein